MDSVDTRIVRMEFDNSQFENAANNTMSTLSKLEDSLKFDTKVTGLDNIQQSFNSFDTSNIEAAIDRVNSHFSTMGIMGKRVIEDLTDSMYQFVTGKMAGMWNASVGQAQTGGWNRASNLANAKFMLKGLKIGWDEVSESIDEAVNGTAYGLDEAAKAASQLAVSGTQLGDDMTKALRGISGVAAMTNSEYSAIADIFTTIAGQGKVMKYQLNQLSFRGLNAAATLAEQLGVTEAEVRELVHKGQIDFTTFANAMDDAFGEHAKAANETFTGSMANIKAALSRIGADFATPYMENMVPLHNDVREFFNTLRKAIAPAVEEINSIIGNLIQMASTGVEGATSFLYKFLSDDQLSALGKTSEEIVAIREALGEPIDIPFLGTLKKIEEVVTNIKEAWTGVTESKFTYEDSPTPSSFAEKFSNILSGITGNEKALSMLTGAGYDKFNLQVNDIVNPDYVSIIEQLTAAGEDFWSVEEMIRQSTHWLKESFTELSDEELISLGYTKEQVEALQQLKLVSNYDFFEKLTEGTANMEDLQKALDNVTIAGQEVRNIGKFPIELRDGFAALADQVRQFNDEGFTYTIRDILAGTADRLFGNVDMNSTPILNWTEDLKETFKDAISSWDLDPETDSINELLGMTDTFGEYIDGLSGDAFGKPIKVAFTPVLDDGSGGTRVLSKGEFAQYISELMEAATDETGKLNLSKMMDLDQAGILIGDSIVSNVIAGISDGIESIGDVSFLGKALGFFKTIPGLAELLGINIDDATEAAEKLEDHMTSNMLTGEEFLEGLTDDQKKIKGMQTALEETFGSDKLASDALKEYDSLNKQLDEVEAKTDRLQTAYDFVKETIQNLEKDGEEVSQERWDTFDELTKKLKASKEEAEELNKQIEALEKKYNFDDEETLAQMRIDESKSITNKVFNALGIEAGKYDYMSKEEFKNASEQDRIKKNIYNALEPERWQLGTFDWIKLHASQLKEGVDFMSSEIERLQKMKDDANESLNQPYIFDSDKNTLNAEIKAIDELLGTYSQKLPDAIAKRDEFFNTNKLSLNEFKGYSREEMESIGFLPYGIDAEMYKNLQDNLDTQLKNLQAEQATLKERTTNKYDALLEQQLADKQAQVDALQYDVDFTNQLVENFVAANNDEDAQFIDKLNQLNDQIASINESERRAAEKEARSDYESAIQKTINSLQKEWNSFGNSQKMDGNINKKEQQFAVESALIAAKDALESAKAEDKEIARQTQLLANEERRQSIYEQMGKLEADKQYKDQYKELKGAADRKVKELNTAKSELSKIASNLSKEQKAELENETKRLDEEIQYTQMLSSLIGENTDEFSNARAILGLPLLGEDSKDIKAAREAAWDDYNALAAELEELKQKKKDDGKLFGTDLSRFQELAGTGKADAYGNIDNGLVYEAQKKWMELEAGWTRATTVINDMGEVYRDFFSKALLNGGDDFVEWAKVFATQLRDSREKAETDIDTFEKELAEIDAELSKPIVVDPETKLSKKSELQDSIKKKKAFLYGSESLYDQYINDILPSYGLGEKDLYAKDEFALRGYTENDMEATITYLNELNQATSEFANTSVKSEEQLAKDAAAYTNIYANQLERRAQFYKENMDSIDEAAKKYMNAKKLYEDMKASDNPQDQIRAERQLKNVTKAQKELKDVLKELNPVYEKNFQEYEKLLENYKRYSDVNSLMYDPDAAANIKKELDKYEQLINPLYTYNKYKEKYDTAYGEFDQTIHDLNELGYQYKHLNDTDLMAYGYSATKVDADDLGFLDELSNLQLEEAPKLLDLTGDKLRELLDAGNSITPDQVNTLMQLFSKLGDSSEVSGYERFADGISTLGGSIASFFGNIVNGIREGKGNIGEAIESTAGKFGELFGIIGDKISSIDMTKVSDIFSGITKFVGFVIDTGAQVVFLIGVILAGITSLVGGKLIDLLSTFGKWLTSEETISKMTEIVNSVLGKLGEIIGAISEKFNAAKTAVEGFINAIKQGPVFKKVTDFLKDVGDGIYQLITGRKLFKDYDAEGNEILREVDTVETNGFLKFFDKVKEVIDGVKESLGKAKDAVVDFFKPFTDPIVTNAKNFIDGVYNLLTGQKLFKNVDANGVNMLELDETENGNAVNILKNIDKAKKAFRDFFGVDKEFKKVVYADEGDIPLGRKIIDFVEKAKEGISKFFTDLNLSEKMTTVRDTVLAGVNDLKERFPNLLSDIWNTITTTGKNILDFITGFFSTFKDTKGFDIIGDAITTLFSKIKSFGGSLFDIIFGKKNTYNIQKILPFGDANDVVEETSESALSLGERVAEAFSTFLERITEFIEKIKGKFGEFKDWLSQTFVGKKLIEIKDFFPYDETESIIENVKNWFSSLVDFIKSKWGELKGFFSGGKEGGSSFPSIFGKDGIFSFLFSDNSGEIGSASSAENVEKVSSGVKGIFESIADALFGALNWIKEAFSDTVGTLPTLVHDVMTLIDSVINWIADTVESGQIERIAKAMQAGAFAYILINLGGMLNQLRQYFKTMKRMLQFKMNPLSFNNVVKFSLTLGVLTAAIVAFNKVDLLKPENTIKGILKMLPVLLTFFTILGSIGAMNLGLKLDSFFTSLRSIGDAVIGLAAGLLILKLVGLGGLGNELIVLGGAIAAFVVAAALIKFLNLSDAINDLGVALYGLGDFMTGLAKSAAILTIVAVLMTFNEAIKDNINDAVWLALKLALIAAGFVALIAVVQKLLNVTDDGAGVVGKFTKAWNTIVKGLKLAALVGALYLITGAVTKLAKAPLWNIVVSFGGLALVLGVGSAALSAFVTACGAAGATAVPTLLAIAAVSAAIGIGLWAVANGIANVIKAFKGEPIKKASKEFTGFGDTSQKTGDRVNMSLAGIGDAVGKFGEEFKGALTGVSVKADEFDVDDYLEEAAESGVDSFSTGIEGLSPATEDAMNNANGIIENAMGDLSNTFSNVADNINSGSGLTDALNNVGTNMETTGTKADGLSGILSGVEGIFGNVSNALSGSDGLNGLLSGLGINLSGIGTALSGGAGGGVLGLFEGLSGILTGGGDNGIVGGIKQVTNALLGDNNSLSNAIDSITGALTGSKGEDRIEGDLLILADEGESMQSTFDKTSSSIGHFIDTILGEGTSEKGISGVIDGVTDKFNNFSIESVTNKIFEAFGYDGEGLTIGEKLTDIAGEIGSTFAQGIKDSIKASLTDTADSIVEWWKGVRDLVVGSATGNQDLADKALDSILGPTDEHEQHLRYLEALENGFSSKGKAYSIKSGEMLPVEEVKAELQEIIDKENEAIMYSDYLNNVGKLAPDFIGPLQMPESLTDDSGTSVRKAAQDFVNNIIDSKEAIKQAENEAVEDIYENSLSARDQLNDDISSIPVLDAKPIEPELLVLSPDEEKAIQDEIYESNVMVLDLAEGAAKSIDDAEAIIVQSLDDAAKQKEEAVKRKEEADKKAIEAVIKRIEDTRKQKEEADKLLADSYGNQFENNKYGGSLWAPKQEDNEATKEAFAESAKYAVDGFEEYMNTEGYNRLNNVTETAADGMDTSFKEKEGIASPSKVWSDYAQYIVDGFMDTFTKLLLTFNSSGFDAGQELNSGLEKGIAVIENLGTSFANSFLVKFNEVDTKPAGESAANKLADGVNSEEVIIRLNNAGMNVANGLIKGIYDKGEDLNKAGVWAADKVNSGFTSAQKIQSPSKLWGEFAHFMTLGLVNQIHSDEGLLTDSALSISRPFENAMYAIKDASESGMEFTPYIAPTIDTSSLYNQAASIDDLFAQRTYNLANISSDLQKYNAEELSRMKQSTLYNDKNVINAIESLESDIVNLNAAIQNMGIYLDSGALVGGLAPGIDKKLGQAKIRRSRGV